MNVVHQHTRGCALMDPRGSYVCNGMFTIYMTNGSDLSVPKTQQQSRGL
jgi:hypothetical protein